MSLNSFRTGLDSVTSNPAGKWILLAIGALLLTSLVLSGTGTNLGSLNGAQGAAQAGGDVIATVNGDALTRDDFTQALNAVVSQNEQMGRTIPAAEQPAVNSAVLEQLIGVNLLSQEAKKENITVTDAEITKKRAQIIDQSNYRQALGLPPTASIADIDAALTKAGNKTVEELYPDDVVSTRILIGDPQSGQPGKLQMSLLNSTVVSDADAQQFYTKYHTQHILIGNKTRSDAQAKVQAAEIIAKAKAPGADFAALAKQYSDDPGSKDKGGDDGFIDQSTQYVPEFKQAAFSLKPGEVTPDPVASPQYGYFIIKLDDVKSSLPPDFAKNKSKYIDAIRQQKAQDKYQALMTGLKAAAKIDVTDPALAGDRALAEAGQAGNPTLSQPKLQAALADYQAALKLNPQRLQKAALEASVGQVYQFLQQTPQAVTAYEAALVLRPDPALEMTAGQLLLTEKQNAQAVAHFQKASQLAWNDQSTHIQLLQMFQQAGRMDLAAKEGDWLKNYSKEHPVAAGGGLPGMPGQSGAVPSGVVPQPAGEIHVAAPPARKPAQ